MKNSWHVATAAEAFCAGHFSRLGWDISVQYGANQPEYDLIAVNSDAVLKVSVKGSKSGGWGLTQSFLKDANYHAAADAWLKKHSQKTVFCLVEFKGVSADAMPRMYLAFPTEIAEWLKSAAAGRGDTILYEAHTWADHAHAAGTTDSIPQNWRFTQERLDEVSRIVNTRDAIEPVNLSAARG